jgi:hypothetical protein
MRASLNRTTTTQQEDRPWISFAALLQAATTTTTTTTTQEAASLAGRLASRHVETRSAPRAPSPSISAARASDRAVDRSCGESLRGEHRGLSISPLDRSRAALRQARGDLSVRLLLLNESIIQRERWFDSVGPRVCCNQKSKPHTRSCSISSLGPGGGGAITFNNGRGGGGTRFARGEQADTGQRSAGERLELGDERSGRNDAATESPTSKRAHRSTAQ